MAPVAPSRTTRDDDFFWSGLQEGKLLLAQCARCAHLQHPPSPMCPECGSLVWHTKEASGHGTVHSWIVSHHPSRPDDDSRIVVLVDLAEGVRLVSNLIDADMSEVANDMPIELAITAVDGVLLPLFKPAPRTR